MTALKWTLTRIDSFVTTKNSSNQTDSSYDVLASTLALEPENFHWDTALPFSWSPTGQAIEPQLSHRSLMRKWESSQMMQTCEVIIFIPIVILTTQKQREPVDEAECSDILCISRPCHWYGTWLEELLWFSQHWFIPYTWLLEIMVLASHVQFNREVNKRLTHKTNKLLIKTKKKHP